MENIAAIFKRLDCPMSTLNFMIELLMFDTTIPDTRLDLQCVDTVCVRGANLPMTFIPLPNNCIVPKYNALLFLRKYTRRNGVKHLLKIVHYTNIT